MSEQKYIKPGVYRHYKGPEYLVYEIARHSETEESLVVYRCLYGDFSLWLRPQAMFIEQIVYQGESQSRFSWHREATDAELKNYAIP